MKLTQEGSDLAHLAGIINMEVLMPKTEQEFEQNIVNANIQDQNVAANLLNIHREHHYKKRLAFYQKLWGIYLK